MANSRSLWQRFINGFRSDRNDRSSDRNRRTRFEPLEHRNLLAIDMLSLDMLALNSMASIGGTVYLDLTDDGLTGDDTLLPGVDVELFRDTGSGTFEDGTDTLVATETTDAIGGYLFDQDGSLIAGDYFVRHESANYVQKSLEKVVKVTITPTDVMGQTGTLIDTFNTTTQSVQAEASGTVVDQSSATAPEAVGGERDLYIEITSPTGIIYLSTNPGHTPGVLYFQGGSESTGTRMLVWDGDDDGLPSTSNVDFVGLGGIDLTDGGDSTGIQLDMGAELTNGFSKITVYTDAGNWSDLRIEIPDTPGGAPSDTGYMSFNLFTTGAGTGADFSNVGAIVLEIEGAAAIDGQIGEISAVGPTAKTVDFANFQPVSLGNLVFNDLNNNGLFDIATENGIAGVNLALWEDLNTNDVIDVGTDVQHATTVTDANGLYVFDTLFPGEYIVEVLQTNFNTGNPLDGFITSLGAPDPDDDVDNDDNGLAAAGRLASLAVTLATGDEPLNDDDLDGNDADSNNTIDFGFVPEIDLTIVKSTTVNSVTPGQQFDYTLDVSNDIDSAIATGVTVVDTLPVGVTFISATPVQTDLTNGVLTFDLGTLLPGGSDTITITVEVDPDATGTLTNDSLVSGNEVEINPLDNDDDAVVTVTEIIDLAVTKSASVDPVIVGENLTYTVTVINNGPASATGVTLSDTLPQNVTFVSASHTNTSVVPGVLTFDLPDLAFGASTSVTIVVNVDSDATDTLTNVASVVGDQQESDLLNNEDQVETDITIISDLGITKTVSQATALPEENLTYSLEVINNGPSDATGVTVVDSLPLGVTFVSSPDGIYDSVNREVAFDLGAMVNGATQTVTFVVSIDSDTAGTLTNQAVVGGDQPDSNVNNDNDDAVTTVTPQTDLAVTKSASETDVAPGGDLTYTILVENNGPSDATGVTVVDTLPEGVTFVSASNTNFTQTATTMTFNLGDLESGDSETITINVTVDADAPETLENTAVVSGIEDDPVGTNDTDQVSTTVTVQLSSIAGYVYIDRDNDGVFDTADQPIPDVLITLSRTDVPDQPDQTETTAADGSYLFEDLNPGTYILTETQPTVFPDGQETLGTPAPGNIGDDAFTEIVLDSDVDAEAYNFGELTPIVSKRMFLASS